MTNSATASNKTVSRRIAGLIGCFILMFLFSIHSAIVAAHDPATLSAYLGFLFPAVIASLAGAAAIDLIIEELTKS